MKTILHLIITITTTELHITLTNLLVKNYIQNHHPGLSIYELGLTNLKGIDELQQIIQTVNDNYVFSLYINKHYLHSDNNETLTKIFYSIFHNIDKCDLVVEMSINYCIYISKTDRDKVKSKILESMYYLFNSESVPDNYVQIHLVTNKEVLLTKLYFILKLFTKTDARSESKDTFIYFYNTNIKSFEDGEILSRYYKSFQYVHIKSFYIYSLSVDQLQYNPINESKMCSYNIFTVNVLSQHNYARLNVVDIAFNRIYNQAIDFIYMLTFLPFNNYFRYNYYAFEKYNFLSISKYHHNDVIDASRIKMVIGNDLSNGYDNLFLCEFFIVTLNCNNTIKKCFFPCDNIPDIIARKSLFYFSLHDKKANLHAGSCINNLEYNIKNIFTNKKFFCNLETKHFFKKIMFVDDRDEKFTLVTNKNVLFVLSDLLCQKYEFNIYKRSKDNYNEILINNNEILIDYKRIVLEQMNLQKFNYCIKILVENGHILIYITNDNFYFSNDTLLHSHFDTFFTKMRYENYFKLNYLKYMVNNQTHNKYINDLRVYWNVCIYEFEKAIYQYKDKYVYSVFKNTPEKFVTQLGLVCKKTLYGRCAAVIFKILKGEFERYLFDKKDLYFNLRVLNVGDVSGDVCSDVCNNIGELIKICT